MSFSASASGRGSRHDTFALSSLQQAVWVDQSLHPGVPLYNLGGAFRLGGDIDAALLERAINHVANAHDVLRVVMTLPADDSLPRQRVLPHVAIPLRCIDFSGDPDGDARARDCLQREFARPFDLDGGLLWETVFVRASATRCYWLHRHHHLVSDGTSVRLMAYAVKLAYDALSSGVAPPDEAGLPLQEFLDDDEDYRASTRFVRDAAFWERQLPQLPPPLLDRVRMPGESQNTDSRQARWSIPRALFDRLSALAAERGASAQHLLLAMLSAYFARTRRLDTVVIGVAVHNRGSSRRRRALGLFAAVLPLVVRVDPDEALPALAARIAADLRRCYRHQRYPIAEINRRLQPAREGRRQIFDLTFSFEDFGTSFPFGAQPARALRLESGHQKTPLSLAVVDHRDDTDVVVDFSYRSDPTVRAEIDRLDPRSARRMTLRWLALLRQTVTQPSTPMGALSLTDAAEQRLLRRYGRAHATQVPVLLDDHRFVHEAVAHWARMTPQAPAVRDAHGERTYAEIDAAATRLAARLRRAGAGRESIVGLCVGRSASMVVGVLGILRAGAAYLPLDPAYPAERLAYLQADSRVALVVTEQCRRDVAAAGGARVLCLDAASVPADDGPALPSAALCEESLAYVIYTSGSTGQPKGVMATHRGLANVVRAYQVAIALEPGQRALHTVSLSFDAGSAHLFLALCSGATLCIDDRAAADARDLGHVLRDEHIQYIGLPVSMLGSLDERSLPALHTLSTGTEACPLSLVERWGRGRRFINIYGPTETSICATLSVFDANRATQGLRRPPIGRPIRGNRAYVLDARLQPVPLGVTGELYIAGEGVTRGYWAQPGQTAARFLPDPFADAPGERMYRTGDLARWRRDGELDFVGRNDTQIKLRGFRVELGEIEAALCAHPAVRESAVAVHEAADGERCLVAYVVAADDVPTAALREHLQRLLPAFMLPRAFVPLARLPLGPNGKRDLQALPAPDFQGLQRDYEPPQGALEHAVAALWSELFGLERVGRDDDFFELGGHSLLATRLVARLRRDLGREIALKTVFDAPTVRQFAAQLAVETTDAAAQPALRALVATGPQPLSHAQQRLWFLLQLDATNTAFHIAGALRLQGELDVAALRGAFAAVVARHASLRTRFAAPDGVPLQIVEATAALDIPLRQARCEDAPELAAAHARMPFDLARAPLLRAELVQFAADDHVLLLSMHHIISDGWSLGVLFGELNQAYAARRARRQPEWTPLPLQYTDFAAWQREWLAAGELERQLGYWRRQLSGLPPLLELPTDRPRPREFAQRGAREYIDLPPALADALQACARREGATLFMLLLAAFKLLLARLSGEQDIAVGTLVANRPRAEFEPLIGFFVNTLVLRSQVEPDLSFRALLARVRETTLASYAHQDVPFDHVVDALRPPRSLAYTPLFQVLFSLQNAPTTPLALAGLRSERLRTDAGTAQFDLTLDFTHDAEGLHGEAEFNTDLFARDTIRAWLHSYSHLLQAALRSPDLPLARFPLGDADACARWQAQWKGPTLALPDDSVPAAILRQARSRPDAIAYRSGGENLSYAELDSRSDGLAQRLRRRGITRESIVGVCLQRSCLLPVAILAIWKAGGVYLPIDPELPAPRIEHLLADADSALLLTDAATVDRCRGFRNGKCTLQADRDDGEAASSPIPRADWHGSQLAYLIYTSGSSGQPKGVAVDHRALIQHCRGVERAYGLRSDDRVLHFAALGFDISLDQLFPPLIAGACVVAREPQLWEPRRFAEKLVELDISVADLPSALWHLLAREWSECAGLPANPRLRLVLVGGEAMASDALRAWRRTPYARVALLNGYGPTETTITASGHDCAVDEGGPTVPIGRPFANRRMYVLDASLQPLPAGLPGELYIGGEGLARGYLGQPALTAAAFLPDPFAAVPGARMYRSGDRARFRADGTLEFLGRVDAQIKLRGHRLELAEVESALCRLPGVRDAAAAVRAIGTTGDQLVGYLVAESEAAPDIGALRAQLAERLPAHAVPAYIVVLDALPLHNGKIHRRQLPTPVVATDDLTYDAPRTPTETWLAGLWAELLAQERVGVDSDFFLLGGHSLLAMRLLARVRERCGVALSVRQVFETPTVAALATCIDVVMCARRETADAQRRAVEGDEREEIEL